MSTILHRIAKWADESPSDIAQRYKPGFAKTGDWVSITVSQMKENITHLASYFETLGMGKSDIGIIFSYNCPQWVQTENAFNLIQSISGGLYPNAPLKDIQYILNLSQPKVIAVQDKKYFAKMGAENIPNSVQAILVYDGETSFHPKAISYEKALEIGRKNLGTKSFSNYLSKINEKDGAYLIFTSGTTGEPKGAILSHDNLAFTADMTIEHWKLELGKGNLFSFLPLCHIAEKLQNLGVGITGRFPVTFSSRMEYLMQELPDVTPSLLLCVPRVWEKIMEGVQSKIEKMSGVQKALVQWALKVGARYASKKYAKQFIDPWTAFTRMLAEKLVLQKIKSTIGIQKVTKGASGSAALASFVSKWYQAIGIEILEDYGQTESTGVVCMTQPGVESSGTVGVAVTGTELKIVEDGEIWTRGRHIFIGYLKNEQATKDTMTEDGWLKTGDLGEMTAKGLIRIKGRKKEIMKTSGGKMIAPVPIENQIRQSPLISQACMVGDGRKYFSALITLSESVLNDLKTTGKINGKAYITDSEINSKIKSHIDSINKSLGNYEKIKYFKILAKDFTIDAGEMTPTLKMKRNIIENNYRAVVDEMYSQSSVEE